MSHITVQPLVYLIRHGQTDWNAEHRLQGQSDTDLNAVGRAQADAQGPRLAALLGGDVGRFDFVSSPMKRARETMERTRRGMGLPPQEYRTDPRIVEVHFGDWQGYTYAELEQRCPDFAATRERDKWNIVPPGEGAESYAMLTERVRPFWTEISRPTVCVAHGGIARAILHILGKAGDDAAHLNIPQDKILRIKGQAAEWIG